MRKARYLYYIILGIICQCIVGVGVGYSVYADINDFNFSSFEADYYLSKDSEGISHLRVVEKLVAEFPMYNQNKGICRYIPFTNQGGANVTLPSLTRSNIEVLRNGAVEPIYSIEREGNFYNVCTGTEEYVTGTQEYIFKYEFSKVVTDFGNYQELYWDTNGNGWLQRFSSATARLHFEEPKDFSGKSWCYVGKYGQKGSEKCEISEISDGVEFKTLGSLAPGENMTFDAELRPGSFTVPEPDNNYILVIVMGVVGTIGAIIVICTALKYLKVRGKENYYKGVFVKPEYQPHEKYGLAEMTELYIGKKERVEVPMLLELVVKRKVKLMKMNEDGKKKNGWGILVKSLEGVDENYIRLLSILNGGPRPQEKSIIKLEQHVASSRLVALKKAMEKGVVDKLEGEKLVLSGYQYGKSGNANIMSKFFGGVILIGFLGFIGFSVLADMVDGEALLTGKLVGKEVLFPVLAFEILTSLALWAVFSGLTQKYKEYTEEGLKESKYMDGLRLYIEMAEAERLKMFQSVKGADTSADGIVKLYEKLLPYAAVFGLEESWMDEMKEYCKVEQIEEPDYLMAGFAASDISRTMRNVSSYVSASTVMSSSGGGSSSGFSGGGGGGFSGGGGGGGGGGGR